MTSRLNKEWNGKLGLDKAAKATLAIILFDVALVLVMLWVALSTH